MSYAGMQVPAQDMTGGRIERNDSLTLIRLMD